MNESEKAHNGLFENENIRYWLTNQNGTVEGVQQFDFRANQDNNSNQNSPLALVVSNIREIIFEIWNGSNDSINMLLQIIHILHFIHSIL